MAAKVSLTLVGQVDRHLAHAIDELSDKDRDTGKAIHGARKRLKAARAILWAIETAADRSARKARRRLAKAARLLAGTRDDDVMAATAAANGFADLAARLRDHAEDTPPLERARAAIEDVRADVARLGIDDDRRVLVDAMATGYRAARRGWKACRSDRSTEALHAWRKQVKRLFYLTGLPDAPGAELEEGLDRLGEILGQDHDNAILSMRIRRMEKKSRKRRAIIAGTRDGLQREAMALATALFSEKSKAFARRLRAEAAATESREAENRAPTTAPEPAATGDAVDGQGANDNATAAVGPDDSANGGQDLSVASPDTRSGPG